ncbi:MAG: recombinase family protein [Solirubrobacteraceae bacterium]
MSEAELHVLKARLRGGSLHKAGKGELRLPLPAGFQYDETGLVRVTPDEAIADAIRTVFRYFDELSSARQVMLRLLEEDRKLPRKSSADRQVRWVTASYKAIHEILTNPVFAGAYAYGRKRTERRVENGAVRERQRRAPREEWHVCIEGHHPGYISFERYLSNQQRLRSNWRAPRGEGGGAAREGRALLQGLIRCGRCGRVMQVGYSGKALVPNYSCVRGSQLYGTKRCQSVGGRRIERVVLDEVFEALRPAGIEATLRAIQDAKSDHQALVHSAELELERAWIHAERARRQFDGCEPENRLVARTLEREWWSRSLKPPTSSVSRPRPCTAGYAKDSSPASRSPRERPGRSGSRPSSAPASATTPPTGGWRSPRPPTPSASPARPCCTRSNAASSPPSTSTTASEKDDESRPNPTKLDCSRTTSERKRNVRPTPLV